ncbi:MAG: hypothetical protein AAB579_00900 [Patescibacteria group bacterium]
MRRSREPKPVLGLALAIGILLLIAIILLYGGQQRLAEELARVASAQGFNTKQAQPCAAPIQQKQNKDWRASRSKTMPPLPQGVVRGSTILFDPVPNQR